jgi:arsenate reductase
MDLRISDSLFKLNKWTVTKDPCPGVGAQVTSPLTTVDAGGSACSTIWPFHWPLPLLSPWSLWQHVKRQLNEGQVKATIYHNPACGTSRKTLEILHNEGADVTVIEYLKAPPSRSELKQLYKRAGITPREGLRDKEPLAEELGLTRPEVTDDEILDAMMEHPVLIQRPLVETEKGARLCRPQEEVRQLL